MSQVTELGSVRLNASDSVTIELVEAEETPAVVVVRWPVKASVINVRQFGAVATAITTAFAGATVRLAQIKRERRL
jgi:hypothetical protein